MDKKTRLETRALMLTLLFLVFVSAAVHSEAAQLHMEYDLNYSRETTAEAGANYYPPEPEFSFPDENGIVDVSHLFPKLIIKESAEDLNRPESSTSAQQGALSTGFYADNNELSAQAFGANIKLCSNEPSGAYCEDFARSCNEINSTFSNTKFWVYAEYHGTVHETSPAYNFYVRGDARDPNGKGVCWGAACDDYVQYNYSGNAPYYGGNTYRCDKRLFTLDQPLGEWTLKFELHDNINSTTDNHDKTISIGQSRGCSIVADSAWRSKDSYACDGTINTSHRFVNNGSLNANYDILYEVYNPDGERIQSGTTSGTIQSNSPITRSIDSPAPSTGWAKPGYYKVRAKMTATCGTTKEVEYTYANAYVPSAPCQQGDIAVVSANSSKGSFACNESLISTHEFKNTGSYDFFYTAYYDLYDPDGTKMGNTRSTPNKTLASGATTTWTITSAASDFGNWTKSGNYKHKVMLDGQFSNGVGKTAITGVSLNVPTACIAGEINTYDGRPDKDSYSCNGRILSTGHRFENTSNIYSFNYKVYYDLLDPNGNAVLTAQGTENQVLAPGKGADWDANPNVPTDGWQVPGKYTLRMWATGKFEDGRERTVYSYSYPQIPIAPCDQITGKDGRPTQDSYACDAAIRTENHIFTNTSTDKDFTYRFYSELYNPQGSKLLSWVSEEKTLGTSKSTNMWTETLAASGSWPMPGTYTIKTWINGKYPNGVERTAYSYAYADVPKAPCEPCKIESDSAWVQQEGLCSERIYTQHRFVNSGTRKFPYNAKFYLYNPSGEKIGETSNSDSLEPNSNPTVWTVWWNVPSGGWRPGTYKSEAILSGDCVGGGSSSASNYASPSMPQSCGATSCNGTINVNVSDNYSSGIGNAKVYLDGTNTAATNSSGNASLSTADASCGNSHSIAIYCENGTHCGTKSTTIDSSGDNDQLNFSCQVCAQSKKLGISVSAGASYSLNDQVTLQIAVTDALGNGVDSSVAISDPFTGTSARLSASDGKFNYNSKATKAGGQTFTITASKNGFESAVATKSIGVNQPVTTIAVSATAMDNSALPGANIYLDSVYDGTTDASGKRSIATPAGNHKIEITCPDPDRTYCASTEGQFQSGVANLSYSCECDIDSDGDGSKDSEEKLFGSDPRSPSSTVYSVVGEQMAKGDCLNPTTLFLRLLPFSQKQQLISNLRQMGHGELSAASSGNATALEMALKNTGISASSVATKKTSLKDIFSRNDKIEGFFARDGAFVIVATSDTGSADISEVVAVCQGNFIGFAGGAAGGLKSDISIIEVPGMIIKGAEWAAQNLKETTEILFTVTLFFKSPEFRNYYLYNHAEDIAQSGAGLFKSTTLGILKEGTRVNTYGQGTQNYAAFQSGFLRGYVVGYIVEQAVVLKGIGEAIKALKLGKYAGEIGTGLKAFSRIGNKFGFATAMTLNSFRAKPLLWTSAEAQDFAAQSLKWFAKTEDADNFMFSLGTKAETAYAKGSKVTQKLTTELGSEEATKKAMSKLLNNEFGKKALAEWTSEDAVKQYAKMFENHYLIEIERFATIFSSQEAEIIVKNLDELSKVQDLKGFVSFEKKIVHATRSDGSGMINELETALKLKNSGYDLLSVGENFADGEIDNVARKISTNEIYATEVKSGNLANNDKIWSQLDRLKKYVDSGKANKARLISKQPVPASVKTYAQERGIEVIEGGI